MTRKHKPPAQPARGLTLSIQLTARQVAFIEAYLGPAKYCAAKAARICGSKSDYAAWQQGYRMMKNPAVRTAIDILVDAQMRELYPESYASFYGQRDTRFSVSPRDVEDD